MRYRNVTAGAVLAAAVAFPAMAWGQTVPTTDAAAPATTAVGIESLEAVVQAVSGKVQVRDGPDQPWRDAAVGMRLPEGAEIRTGLRSAVRCTISDGQVFTLDRLGTISLVQAVRQGNKETTNLAMKYGRTQYQVEKAGLEHDGRITSPVSTLAVRGTTVELEDTPPFKPRAISYTGRASFSAERRTTPVGAAGGTRTELTAGFNSVTDAALVASVVDPQYGAARTPSDNRFLTNETSRGAVVGFDNKTKIRTITGGAGPIRTEADLRPTLPGTLQFVARWTGNADVNLSMFVSYGDVNDPKTGFLATGGRFTASELVYPGFGLNVSKTGGRTDFDHRGGANGGTEIVYWGANYPQAAFGFDAVNVGGATATVTVNAFLNGQKLSMYDLQSGIPSVAVPSKPVSTEPILRSDSFTYTLTPGQQATPLVFVPVFTLLDEAIPDLSSGPADLDPVGGSPGAPKAKATKPAKVATAGQRTARAAAAADARPVERQPPPALQRFRRGQ